MIYINGNVVEDSQYPNAETIFRQMEWIAYEECSDIWLKIQYESDRDIFRLQIISKFLKKRYPYMPQFLEVDYMPYSRMDRATSTCIFTLQYVAEIINALEFEAVYILDPHSPKTLELINNSEERVSDLTNNILKVFNNHPEISTVCFPDAGAMGRYSQFIFNEQIKIIHADKHRDTVTGRIDYLKLPEGTSLGGEKVLVVDDICSYGGTIKLCCEALKRAGAEQIIVYFTHCEPSFFKGSIPTHPDIHHIYTTNSLVPKGECDRFTVLESE